MYCPTRIALTNASLLFNALLANDKNLYGAVHNHIFTMGEEKYKQRAQSQLRHRENRKMRLPRSDISTESVNI